MYGNLLSRIVEYMKEMKSDEENCHKPEGEFCAQCRERSRLRRELVRIIEDTTQVSRKELGSIIGEEY